MLALIFIFGALVGSFLNVCIYRIPAGRSVVFPRSRCACGQAIPWYWNVPVFSWMLARGRARCCGGRFSIRYPFTELLTAILFSLVWWQAPSPLTGLTGMVFTFILIAASFIDYDTLEIPDRFSIGGMLTGLALSSVHPALHGQTYGIDGFISALTGAIIGAGIFYWVTALGYVAFQKDAMGEGDVKLAGCIGAFCGWQATAFILVGGAIAGLLLAPLMWLASRQKDWQISEDPEDDSEEGFGMPFGPALCLAAWFYWMGWDFGLLEFFQPPR